MRNMLVVLTLILIEGCGNGESAPSQPSTSTDAINLEALNSFELGSIYSSSLKNILGDGNRLYGHISIENTDEKVDSGVVVTPREMTFDATYALNGGGTNAKTEQWKKILYFDKSNGNLISFSIVHFNFGIFGVTTKCLSSSPYHMPDKIKVGDHDAMPGFSCDNKANLDGGSWTAIAASEGKIKLQISSKTINVSGNIADEEVTYTFDSSGKIVDFSINDMSSFKLE